MARTLNDNGDGSRPPRIDAHGHAALVLVESLLHGLVARKLIATTEAIEMVEVASEVIAESAHHSADDAAIFAHSLVLLEAIGRSLAIDLPPAGLPTLT